MALYHKVPNMSTTLARVWLLVCLGLLTLSAGAAIGLKISSYHFVETNSHVGAFYGDGAQGLGILFLPLHLHHTAPAALTMTAVSDRFETPKSNSPTLITVLCRVA